MLTWPLGAIHGLRSVCEESRMRSGSGVHNSGTKRVEASFHSRCRWLHEKNPSPSARRIANFFPFVEAPRRMDTTILHGARVFGRSATISSFAGEFHGQAAGWWWWFAEDHCRPRCALSPWLHKEVELIDREPVESLCLRRKFFFHCRVATVSCDSIWYAPHKRGEFLRFRGIRRTRASAFACKNAKHVCRRELSPATATSFRTVSPFDVMRLNPSFVSLVLKCTFHWAFVHSRYKIPRYCVNF